MLENAVRTLLLLTKSLTCSVFEELLAGDAGGLSFFETATHNLYLLLGMAEKIAINHELSVYFLMLEYWRIMSPTVNKKFYSIL